MLFSHHDIYISCGVVEIISQIHSCYCRGNLWKLSCVIITQIALVHGLETMNLGNGNYSPKCHFVTYYSHFRVLGNLAKIFGLNRGKTPKKNANFDF